MLVARLFGPLELAVDGRQLGARDLGGTKPRQLLEILLLDRGHVVPKDRLAELLWGDDTPVNVSATLDTYASTLRRCLQPDRRRGASRYLVGGGGGLLAPAEETDVDLARFDEFAARAQAHARAGEPVLARAAAESALALVRGQVLEDEPYASWALRLRDTYTERAIALRLAAAGHALSSGDAAGALAHAHAVLEADPVREAAYRTLMLAAYRLGHQDEALRAYERCRRALAGELGVDPLPETVALHEGILRRDGRLLSASPEPAVPPPALPPADGQRHEDLPLLGRRAELATLLAAARQALAGAGGLVLVEGEGGIGKTRLLEELLARLQPLRTATAKCAEVYRDLPYVPLASALRDLGAPALPAVAALPALGEILPELPASDLPPETARLRALESVATLLGQLAPLALFIDDLQWADASTVAALAYLQRRCAGSPVLLLGALRPEEVNGEEAVARLDAPTRLTLQPLEAADLEPLGGATAAAALLARSGGHPLWLTELVRAGSGAQDQGAPPERLAELIVARCRRAGPRAHRLLAAASVLGRPFGPELVAALTGEDPLVAAEQLEHLSARGLARPAGGEFAFRHDLIADALLAAMSPARRRALHARALQALEAAGAPAGELAGHALGAGLAAPAMRWSLAAGAAARQTWANVEAAEHYRRARVLAGDHPDLLDAPARERMLVESGRVLVTLGQVDEAESLLEAARAAAAQRGDERSAFAAVEGLSVARQRGASDPERALALGRQALAVARRLDDPDLLARAHTLVGSPSGSLGLLDDEVRHCKQAVAIAEKAGVVPPAYPMGRVALGLHHQGHEHDALGWARRAEDSAIEQHDEETLLVARWVRGLACAALGQAGEALAALDACRQVGRGEEVFWHARIPNTYGSVLADLCLHGDALERDLESLEVATGASAAPIREAEFHTRLNLATDHLALGDPEAAARQVAIVRAGAGEVVYARFRWLARLHALEAELATGEGRHEEALVAAEACLDLAERHGQAKYRVRGRLALSRAHLACGRPEAAAEAALAACVAKRHGFDALAWRCWWSAHLAGAGPHARRHAREAVRRVADGLEEPLASRFLGAVPVEP